MKITTPFCQDCFSSSHVSSQDAHTQMEPENMNILKQCMCAYLNGAPLIWGRTKTHCAVITLILYADMGTYILSFLNIYLFTYLFIVVHVCVHVCIHVYGYVSNVHVEVKGQLAHLVFSFYHVGPDTELRMSALTASSFTH